MAKDLTTLKCPIPNGQEGSFSTPQTIENELLLAKISPVEYVRRDSVEKPSDYGRGGTYKVWYTTLYSYPATKFYRIRLSKDLDSTFLAFLEIAPEKRTFVAERDAANPNKLIWNRMMPTEEK